jgi:DNA invertase Pin-like site-specific DNA recombinase
MRSLGDQSKLAIEEAKRVGVRIVHEIVESKSARRPGMRPGFQEMLDWIEEGKADGILCWHPDRLARNAVDGGWILDLLDRGKLRDLHFLSYHFDNSAEGKFALGMVFSQAKYQVDKLSTDVSRGMREMRQEGGFPHYVPEGYKNVRLDNGKKAVEIDLERFSLLRRAVEVMLAEVYPPAEVRRMLNRWGYQTRTTKDRVGGPLSEGAFYRIFKNPFYCGLCKDGDTYYDGLHEPLMTRDEFARLQRILTRGSNPAYRKHTYAYARGLFTCGKCGCQITATLSKGKAGRGAWIYYHCTNKKGVCDKRGTREDRLDAPVRDLLEKISLPIELEPIVAEMVEAAVRETEHLDVTTAGTAVQRLAEAKCERSRLVSLLAKAVLTPEDFTPARNALDEEIRELEDRVTKVSGRQAADIEAARNVVSFAAQACQAFEVATPEGKRHIVRMMTMRRVLTPGQPLLEPHPYLHGFVELHDVLKGFKPLESGSPNTKASLSTEKLAFGRPNRYRNKNAEMPSSILSACQVFARSLASNIQEVGEFFAPWQPVEHHE